MRDTYCGHEVVFETCVTMKFVDDDDEWHLQTKNYYVAMCHSLNQTNVLLTDA